MKTIARNLGILFITVITFALVGCASLKETPVTQSPPAPQQETAPTPPTGNYVWAEGHWAWQGQWVWQSGRWMLRPNTRAIWENGQWEQTKHGWVWQDGQWKYPPSMP